MLAFWSLLVQNSVSLNTLPGCRCAGKTRLRGLFTSQLISRKSLRTSSFSSTIQSLGRDISQSALLLPFSALFGKLLILVGLIGGAGSLTDDDSFHETSSISRWDTIKAIETKIKSSPTVYCPRFTSRVTHVHATTGPLCRPSKQVICCLRVTPLPLSFSPTASSDPLGAGSLFLFSRLPSILTLHLSEKIIFSHILQNLKLSSG